MHSYSFLLLMWGIVAMYIGEKKRSPSQSNPIMIFATLVMTLATSTGLNETAIAQDYEGCWMVNSAGAVIDLNGSVCPRSPAAPVSTSLSFSNLRVESTSDGRVAVLGSVTNRSSQPVPVILVEYKLIDSQSQEVLYKGLVPLATPGTLQAGESINFSRLLNASRLPRKPLTAITVQIDRYL